MLRQRRHSAGARIDLLLLLLLRLSVVNFFEVPHLDLVVVLAVPL